MGSGITLACTGRPKAGGANVGDNETSGVARLLSPVKPALGISTTLLQGEK